MYSVEFYADIISSFELLLKALDKLCEHVLNDLQQYPVWIDNGQGQFIHRRKQAVYAIKHISPCINLSPTETFVCPGVMGATVKTFALIDKLNKSKDDFKQTVLKYKDICKRNTTRPVREILAIAGYGGVKLMQVYRHITYVDFHPRRIAWSKSKNATYNRISITAARKMLLKAGQGKHIDIQLSKLGLLKPHQKLVIFRQTRDYWGVNIATFKNQYGHSKNYRLRDESLPLFYLHDKKLSEPIVCYSNKIKSNIRSDKKVEKNVFLKSIKAYRYIRYIRYI
jgi:hypothetical protein